jgi:hypothetical protein
MSKTTSAIASTSGAVLVSLMIPGHCHWTEPAPHHRLGIAGSFHNVCFPDAFVAAAHGSGDDHDAGVTYPPDQVGDVVHPGALE